MLYTGLYDGPKIDALLESIKHIKVIINGWVKLETSVEYPTDLNKLMNPGNFSTAFWLNGPAGIVFNPPLNIVVTKEKNAIRQYIFSTGYNVDGYMRVYHTNTGIIGEWESIHLNKAITVGEEAPNNPDDDYIWINVKNNTAVIQYYIKSLNVWVNLNPYGHMDSNIYNPNKVDIDNVFKYIDEKVKNVSGGESPVDFSTHITDNSIHLTSNEKNIFNDKMTDSDLLTAMQTIAEELNQYIANKAFTSGIDISALEKSISDISTTLENHTNNHIIHPTQEQIDDWDSKSNADHTHTIDQIELDTSNVIGSFTIDQIPDDAKERQVNISSKEELLTLTINDVQNGDFIYINYSENKNEILIVADQTKLGTYDAFISYIPSDELLWKNVQNKPTTLGELQIVDMVDNDQVDKMEETLLSDTETAQESVNSACEKYSYANNERIQSTHILETNIDSADYKLTKIHHYVNLTENILSKLEAITQ